MRHGDPLVIGGLLQHRRVETIRGVPYLKDLPFLGYAFRTTLYDENLIEVVVAVRPTLVRPIAPGDEIPLPTERGPLTRQDERTQPEPAKRTRPRIPGLP
jgi:Flp pilus assembly secretin CpaC